MFPKVLYIFTLSQILLDSEKVPKALRQADVNRLLNRLIIVLLQFRGFYGARFASGGRGWCLSWTRCR